MQVFLLLALLTASEIKPDERVVFFTTSASRAPADAHWTVPIHGWIFEPERNSPWRREVIEEVQEHLRVAPDSPEGRRCADRAAMFLVDNERGKFVSVRIAGRVHRLYRSQANGHFRSTLMLKREEVARHAKEGALTYEALLGDGDKRRFRGRVLLPQPSGFGVISDIDDTIKVSHVLDRRELLRHTFARVYEAVPGMADAYAAWAKRGASFHFVSSSPWQLYPFLEPFTERSGFPPAAFHLKSVRLKDRTLRNLFKPALDTKPPVIRAILQRHPRTRFILVGDSGEHDPEVYGRIARGAPDRIVHVFIRRVDGARNDSKRFAAAFAGVAAAKWTVFSDPRALKSVKLER